MELVPRTPCGMPIAPGELRGGHPWLDMRARDCVGLADKGMEMTDSICRTGEDGTAARSGVLEERGCLVDMEWLGWFGTRREREAKRRNEAR